MSYISLAKKNLFDYRALSLKKNGSTGWREKTQVNQAGSRGESSMMLRPCPWNQALNVILDSRLIKHDLAA